MTCTKDHCTLEDVIGYEIVEVFKGCYSVIPTEEYLEAKEKDIHYFCDPLKNLEKKRKEQMKLIKPPEHHDT